MSNAASFEFRHLHRHLKPEESIPPLPSLLQQLELLTQDLHHARNQIENGSETPDPLIGEDEEEDQEGEEEEET